jgi:hypothetical protein
MDKKDVGFKFFEAGTSPFVSPAQLFPATFRLCFILFRILTINQMWWMWRQESGNNFAFTHVLYPLN